MQDKLSAGLLKGSQFLAAQALNIGQSTFDFFVNLFAMLYLLFFLLRDEDALAKRIKSAIPLRPEQLNALLLKFTVVIRATVKGDLLVALLQGALGGLIFWFLGITASLLWAVLMAFLSLLPAIGAGLVWAPVAIYHLATGSVWQGVVLIAYGALVIGLVDNFLRPILVGKDTKMPDYVVLISTLGGIEAFGLNGFVIGPVIAAKFIAGRDIFSASRQNDAFGSECTRVVSFDQSPILNTAILLSSVETPSLAQEVVHAVVPTIIRFYCGWHERASLPELLCSNGARQLKQSHLGFSLRKYECARCLYVERLRVSSTPRRLR